MRMEEKHVREKDPRRRHRIVWKLLRPLAKVITWLRLGFRAAPARVKGPYLLVCNHVTDWDPVLVACSFPEQHYYVASEHLMRSGLGGRLVSWAQAPIPRLKGGNAAGTVLTTALLSSMLPVFRVFVKAAVPALFAVLPVSPSEVVSNRSFASSATS